MKHLVLIVALLIVAGVAQLYNAPAPETHAQSIGRTITVLSSASRTATTAGDDYLNEGINTNVTGAYLTLDVTGVLTSPTITLTVQAKDPASGQYEAIFNAASGVGAAGVHTYLIYPGVGAASNDVAQVVSRPLPPAWRVQVIHANTDPITYSVGAMLVD